MQLTGKLRGSLLFRNAKPLSEKQNRILNLFFFTTLIGTFLGMLGIILYYVYSLAAVHAGSEEPLWLLSIFSDFVEIMNASLKDSPYITDGTSYPPIAVMVLYPFALICKNVFAGYSGVEGMTVDELTAQVILHPEFWIAIVLFFLVCFSSISLIVIKKLRLEPIPAAKVSCSILMSAPFVYAIMRGNTIYFALIFLLLFLLLYDSPKPVLREISYLCLVLAGCIKIYPLFFGVFLLKKKRIFASFRVAIYFIAIFLLSFFLFSGGMDGLKPFLENLGGFMSNDERLLSLRNLSLSALIYKIFYLISPSAATSSAFGAVNLAVLLTVFILATVTAVAARSNLSRAMIASAVMIMIPSITYFYVLIFMIPPFIEMLRDYDTLSDFKKRLYPAAFLFLFTTFLLLPQCFIPHTLIVIALMVTEEVSVIKNELIPYFKNRKLTKKHL